MAAKPSPCGDKTAHTGIVAVALILVLGQVINRLLSARFFYHADPLKSPIIEFVGINMLAGAIFLAFIWLIPRVNPSRVLLLTLFTCGILMRLVLFDSNAVLEIDFYRYLWDGAVSANGFNPYQLSPAQISTGELAVLAQQSAPIFERINYPELRTIYPPLSQLFFALAYWIDDWSLNAWRLVLLLADLAGLAAILLTLKRLGRSAAWSALYWLNPLIVMLTYNGLHMDILLVAPLVIAIACMLGRRNILASVALTVAAGIKLWPLILLPFALRPLLSKPKSLLLALALIALVSLALIAPLLYYGLGEHSGLGAFAQSWQRNSGLFPLLHSIATFLFDNPDMATRLFAVTFILTLTLYFNYRSITNSEQLTKSICWTIVALFMLSPAQFPWYCLWFLPLLCFYANPVLLLFAALMPIYYLKFYFVVQGQPEVFDRYIVWLQTIPVLMVLSSYWFFKKQQPWAFPRHV